MAGTTRLELATSCVTGMRSNQTELRSQKFGTKLLYLLKNKMQDIFLSTKNLFKILHHQVIEMHHFNCTLVLALLDKSALHLRKEDYENK